MPDPVPNLTTAQTGPLLSFEQRLLDRAADIEAWFRAQWQRSAPPFYGSVDLRNAGFKLAPVDTNLFPAGFNNLNPAFEALCVQAIQAALTRIMPSACGVLLVPENHTRNRHYLENVAVLQSLIEHAGYKVRIGSLRPELKAPETLALPSGRTLKLEPIVREGERVMATLDVSVEPDLIINVEGGQPRAIAGLKSLLTEIERARSQRGQESETARLAAIKADSKVAAALITPLHNALNSTGCALAVPDFDFAVNRALTVLAHPEIKSLRVR